MRTRQKRLLNLLGGVLLSSMLWLAGEGMAFAAEEVVISDATFPDANFRTWVSEKYDTDGNGSLSEEELRRYANVSVQDKGIKDLTGLHYFSHITNLNCDNNELTSLDLTGLNSLKSISCANNQLSSLDVSELSDLTYLNCFGNRIYKLNINGLDKLTHLVCGGNCLTRLDVSNVTNLEKLNCSANYLTYLDVSNLNELQELLLHYNNLRGLKLNADANYVSLYVIGNYLTKENIVNGENIEWDTEQYGFSPQKKEKEYAITDVPANPGNWKYDSVVYVYNRDIMGDVGGSGEFQPDNTLTRAMFATVLHRMAAKPPVTFEDKFPDVEAGKWYSDAIIWANQNGIVNGYGDGTFGINDNITREQIAKMLYLYGQNQGYDVSGRASLDDFTDDELVSGWAVEYVQWAVDAKMISGKPNNDGTYRLDPKGQATRAECAKMLMMFSESYK